MRRIQRIDLAGPAGHLEALLLTPSGKPRATALVCHPHPQHGGSMHSRVVYRTARALESDAFSVLRFNFRGVGHSDGQYDGGRGELEDARAALRWLNQHHPGLPVVVGGFSFGAAVALRLGAASEGVHALLGIAPPLNLYSFDFLKESNQPLLFVAGSEDPFCPPQALLALQEKLGKRVSVTLLDGAGHLLTEGLRDLQVAVQAFVSRSLPRAPLP